MLFMSPQKVCLIIRFIVDLITINNQYIKMNICQAELELKKESQVNKNVNFLDSNINKI